MNEILSNSNFYLFICLSLLPAMLFIKGKNTLIHNKGFIAILCGTILLTVASFLVFLSEMSFGNFLHDYALFNMNIDVNIDLFLYLPAILIAGYGLSNWLPDIRRLSDEVRRRAETEKEMIYLLKEMQAIARREEEANQAKGQFLATMSHELRTPLNAVIGFADALRLPTLQKSEEERAEYLEIISDSGGHLLSLINDILDLSKVEQGKLELSYSKFNVSTEIVNNIAVLNLSAEKKNIKLNKVLKDIDIVTDERIFKQIIINIISNAIKFSPEDTVVTIRVEETDNGVCVSIEDQGIGMSEKELARALKPFVQIENTYTRNFEGSGLGLALVSRFLTLIGGELNISSIKEQGTTVKVYFADLSDVE